MRIAGVVLALPLTVTAFVPSRSSTFVPTPVCGFTEELEEMWSADPLDAMKVTTDLVRDEAFDYRKQVMMRIKRADDNNFVGEDSLEQAAAEYQEGMIITETGMEEELRFVSDYKMSLDRAQQRFVKEVEKAETSFTKRIENIEASYEAAFGRGSGSAKQQYIMQLSTNHELFQIALEKAELNFEERKIKALQAKAKEEVFYEEFRKERMGADQARYLTASFGNLIAF